MEAGTADAGVALPSPEAAIAPVAAARGGEAALVAAGMAIESSCARDDVSGDLKGSVLTVAGGGVELCADVASAAGAGAGAGAFAGVAADAGGAVAGDVPDVAGAAV